MIVLCNLYSRLKYKPISIHFNPHLKQRILNAMWHSQEKSANYQWPASCSRSTWFESLRVWEHSSWGRQSNAASPSQSPLGQIEKKLQDHAARQYEVAFQALSSAHALNLKGWEALQLTTQPQEPYTRESLFTTGSEELRQHQEQTRMVSRRYHQQPCLSRGR